jgi:hypothetical protein
MRSVMCVAKLRKFSTFFQIFTKIYTKKLSTVLQAFVRPAGKRFCAAMYAVDGQSFMKNPPLCEEGEDFL